MEELKQLYKLKEVAQVLRVTERTLYSYIKDGRLNAVKIGNRWKVSGDEVRAFIARSQG